MFPLCTIGRVCGRGGLSVRAVATASADFSVYNIELSISRPLSATVCDNVQKRRISFVDSILILVCAVYANSDDFILCC
jgi:hypothetical protein